MRPLDRLGGRKFVLCVLVTLCVTLLLAMGKQIDMYSAGVLLGSAGAYITGNVAQKRLVPTTAAAAAPTTPEA